MSASKRFRYPLQPVLLTRQWHCDALLQELGEINAQLDESETQLGRLQNAAAAAQAAQQQAVAVSQLTVDSLRTFSRYLHDVGKQIQVQRQQVASVQEQRAALIERVSHAQRGVEAVERHRDDLRADFDKLQASAQYKVADENWATLLTRTMNHDCES
jgi:flagellar export protein FliJ